jgi:saccharopine dehydrogenase-like NADP-dependent oxidoreductase
MKRILLLGVGRSTHTLIKYLSDSSVELDIEIILADKCQNSFIEPYLDQSRFSFIKLDINNNEARRNMINSANIVISMLPHNFHHLVAKDCVLFKKHLITASYVSEEVALLHDEAKLAGILILNECGLDPGIDHLSAMDIIDKLHDQGAIIHSFKSFCGGLVSPEYNNNPWGYKFTWNPKNVVLAGKQGALYLENSLKKSLLYSELFQNLTPIDIPNYGNFEAYANRDSLHYKEKYNLLDAHTIIRGTLRENGFSSAWDVFVQTGMTSESSSDSIINQSDFYNYLNKLNNKDIDEKMRYLDLFNINHKDKYYNNPSEYLLNVLIDKWNLDKNDKDMIVMQHIFNYSLSGVKKDLKSSMVVKGDDNTQTAMAKTVGLPLFFACKLILQNKISLTGVHIPIHKEIYQPILKSLDKEGLVFFNSPLTTKPCT